ncbi:MAG: hydrogenase formation protein HypD [Nitrospirota bacterium]|nr:hydrogenase formation protein HypD [Nitrospirota bacterium]
MKYLDEFRDSNAVQKLSAAIHQIIRHPWTIMEVCGGQTHSIVKYGLDRLLPPEISLIHGPGCPVCVTPIELIDAACELAKIPDVIFCSFGDMLRVPGTHEDLLRVKAQGGDVRIIYSPLDAVALAQANPSRQVVIFAVGFETTAPAQAMAILQAQRLQLKNFFVLVAHVLVPPAMEALLSSPENRIQGFLAAGHVCTIMGYDMYEPISQKYQVPIVVTGFEPVDILEGVKMVVHQLEEGRSVVENQYARSVHRSGNLEAQKIIDEVFEPSSRHWRGIGNIPNSGLQLRPAFAKFDALQQFHDRIHLTAAKTSPSSECQSGQILQGLMKPSDCGAFGTRCTPDHPLGAPMVSSEGACAAYFRYRPSKVAGL